MKFFKRIQFFILSKIVNFIKWQLTIRGITAELHGFMRKVEMMQNTETRMVLFEKYEPNKIKKRPATVQSSTTIALTQAIVQVATPAILATLHEADGRNNRA